LAGGKAVEGVQRRAAVVDQDDRTVTGRDELPLDPPRQRVADHPGPVGGRRRRAGAGVLQTQAGRQFEVADGRQRRGESGHALAWEDPRRAAEETGGVRLDDTEKLEGGLDPGDGRVNRHDRSASAASEHTVWPTWTACEHSDS